MRFVFLGVVAVVGFAGCPGQEIEPTFVAPDERLSAGQAHTCNIVDGALFCWGANTAGQLGLGFVSVAEPPTRVGEDSDWRTVSAGGLTTCGLRHEQLYCWGSNAWGSVGDGTSLTRPAPVRIDGRWSKVAVGNRVTCAITLRGALFCWGDGSSGLLGDESATQNTPVAVGTSVWNNVAVAEHHACGIQSEGSLWCWGWGSLGELGVGEVNSAQRQPLRVGTANNWRQVTLSSSLTCALDDAGERTCFGMSLGGIALSPIPADDSRNQATWASFALGGAWNAAGCGIRKNGGGLWCWGYNFTGLVGDGTNTTRLEPVLIDANPGWVSVTVGSAHACAVRSDAQNQTKRYCWGSKTLGQFGFTSDQMHQVEGSGWASVSTAQWQSVGIRSDGSHGAWGTLWWTGCAAISPTPAPAFYNANWDTVVVASSEHSPYSVSFCGLTTNGRLACWGENRQGQVGIGNTDAALGPRWHGEPDSRWRQVSVSGLHTCAIREDSSLWCWGRGDEGQLGDGLARQHLSPTRVDESSWESVAVGAHHTCGIKDDGSLWCWGSNADDQLGVGKLSSSSVSMPMQVGSATWRAVTTGVAHTCGLQSDSSLWCWGANTWGELGQGHTQSVSEPTRVADATDWVAVYAGDSRTCGLRGSGSRWCWGEDLKRTGWGFNFYGEYSTFSLEPQRQDAINNWATLSIGASHECGIQADGSLWCWGSNDLGEQGTGPSWHTTPQEL